MSICPLIYVYSLANISHKQILQGPGLIELMANQELKNIPRKTLKKVVSKCNFEALITSKEGLIYFESRLSQYPEFNQYWVFFKTVGEFVDSDKEIISKLDSVKQCFEKHIAIAADPDDRIGNCLQNRNEIEELSKLINNSEAIHCHQKFKELRESAFQHLKDNLFVPKLMGDLNTEYNSRHSKVCDLS